MLNEMIVNAAVSMQTQKLKVAVIARDESIDAMDCACVDIGSPPNLAAGLPVAAILGQS